MSNENKQNKPIPPKQKPIPKPPTPKPKDTPTHIPGKRVEPPEPWPKKSSNK